MAKTKKMVVSIDSVARGEDFKLTEEARKAYISGTVNKPVMGNGPGTRCS